MVGIFLVCLFPSSSFLPSLLGRCVTTFTEIDWFIVTFPILDLVRFLITGGGVPHFKSFFCVGFEFTRYFANLFVWKDKELRKAWRLHILLISKTKFSTQAKKHASLVSCEISFFDNPKVSNFSPLFRKSDPQLLKWLQIADYTNTKRDSTPLVSISHLNGIPSALSFPLCSKWSIKFT